MRTEDILAVVAASARDVENWIIRLDLSTGFEKPGRGRARTYSLRNTMELALLAAFVRAGLEPAKALAHTRGQVEPALRLMCPEWYIIPVGDVNQAYAAENLDLNAIQEKSGTNIVPVYSLIGVQEIARRVLALYET